MAVTNGYVTVAEVRDHLGDAGARLDQDVIERAINAASRRIDRFTGRRFWIDATVQQRRYNPGDPIEVLIDDVATKTGLVVATDDTGDGSYATTWTIETDFTLEPLNADQETSNAYSWWVVRAVGTKTFTQRTPRPSLRVTAKFGWAAVPDDVVEAALLLTTHLIRRKDAPFGVAGMGEFGAVRVARMDPDVRALIQPYVRMTGVDR